MIGDTVGQGNPPTALPVPAMAALPTWPKPMAPALPGNAPAVHCGDLDVVHAPDAFGGFVVRVAGQLVAIGQDRPMIGYVVGGELRWFDLAHAGNGKVSVRAERGAIRLQPGS